jgi:uridine kinase
MIGDKIVVKPYHIPPAREIFQCTKDQIASGKYSFAISGESGCGKSTLAIALKMVLTEAGYGVYIFHMDDYFLLPPTTNHNQRVEDINHVGPQEVNLSLLQHHVASFRNGVSQITKPLVHYKENDIKTELVDFDKTQIVIIEGTYTSLLENIDCKIFIDRTYKDTYLQRAERAREEMTPFIESVLEIEHAIIAQHKSLANIVLDQDYSITKCDI